MKSSAIALLLAAAGAFAAPNAEPYPQPASKKGLQVQMVDDALALGIQHAGLNCHVASYVDLVAKPDSIKFTFDGADYFFRASRVAALDAQIKPLSDRGVVISLILLNYENGDEALNAIFLHPKYARSEKHNRLSAFNVVTPEGSRHLRAAIAFLAQRYSDSAAPHGRVWNYIVSNEVNSHWWWNNQGRTDVATLVDDYERTVRLVHENATAHLARARVFLSLEHHWNIRYSENEPGKSCAGRELVEEFARLARERGDFAWHIAFHPYPENLGDPRFWNDKTATPGDDTPRITFKNLEVLTRFLERPEMRFAGQPRRVILSEQGFHCMDEPDGEQLQAAAYAAAWMKVARLPGIDSFILHRHVDHAHEGLNLGLWTHKPDTVSTPDRHRPMYEVFRAADTPEWEKAFAFALPIIGAKSWEEFAPKP
jgi:hypothetical protein